MKRIINTKLFLFLILFSSGLLAQDNQFQWIEFPDPLFKVSGLPSWDENKPDLFRLPKSSKNKVRKPEDAFAFGAIVRIYRFAWNIPTRAI